MMQSTRFAAIENFLKTCSIIDPQLSALPADASFRQYYKIHRSDSEPLLLMDCPPEHYSVLPFISVSSLLHKAGVNVPNIYAVDEKNGLVLLECFNGPVIGQIMSSSNEVPIYKAILQILVSLQTQFKQYHALKIYSPEVFLKEIDIFLDWYASDELLRHSQQFKDLWQQVLAELAVIPPSFCHLDFHVENIMLTKSDSEEITSDDLGLIDFQDARIGSPIYDVVSLLEDARREVGFDVAAELFSYYLSLRPELSMEDASQHYHILGAQRNTRILGVFARKAKRDGNDNYLQYIPRLHQYLEHDLMLPVFAELREFYKKYVFI